MVKLLNFVKRSTIVLGMALLLGAVLAPDGQVKAAANWWWNVHYPGGAPGAYQCSVGATSNGAPVKAFVKGISTSTRVWVTYIAPGDPVTAPNTSRTHVYNLWNGSGGYIIY